ncbi:MAG: FtsX-like permease family protein [Candidatus Limnocylindria bacterium]
MGGLQGLAWRGLRARPLRTLLTTLGVALGVAVLYAGLATNVALDASIDRTVGVLVGRADLRVSAFGETGLSEATVATIAATDGVDVAAATIERRTYLGIDLFAPGDTLPAPVTVVGIDPTRELRAHDLPLATGSMLARPDEPSALISATLAREDRLSVGSAIEIQGPGEPGRYRVIGVLRDDGPWAGAIGRAVVVPFDVLRSVFPDAGVTRVDVVLRDGASAADVTAALQASLVTEPYVLSSPRDIAASMRASTGDFVATAALISAVALFAGAFLIFNTLSMTVVERLRELGLLRAAGASRDQVTGFMLVQASVIGVLGSMLGVGLGIVLGGIVAAWVRTVGDVPLGTPAIAPGAVAVSLALGVVVTLAAALEPARRAGRIAPVEALKARLDLPSARRARLRWLIGVFALIGLAGLFLWPRGAGEAALVRALAVYAVLLVAALLVPVILPLTARLAGLPFVAVTRLEERLARASLLRDRSRAALTVGALTVGLSMVVALGGVAQHARAAASAWIVDVVPGDLVVTSIFPRALDEGLGDLLGGLDGVAAVSPIATFDLAVAGVRVDGAAMVGADLAADGRLRFVAGDRGAALADLDRGGGVIVPAGVAARDGLSPGDVLTATAADGSAVSLRVLGVAERTLPGREGEAVLIGWADAERLGVAGADAFAIRFASDATVAQRTTVAAEARAVALEPAGLGDIQGAIGQALDRIFGLFDALALIAVVVASLGIVNTLTMNVLERVREIGILRAAGMTRRQVWRTVVIEAGMTGLVGAAAGVVVGIAVGALMVILGGGTLAASSAIPWPTVGLALVLGVGLAMVAAAYPARLASRLSIVRAVATE